LLEEKLGMATAKTTAVAASPAEEWQQGQYHIRVGETIISLESPYNEKLVQQVRGIPTAQWHAETKRWRFARDQYDKVLALAKPYAEKAAELQKPPEGAKNWESGSYSVLVSPSKVSLLSPKDARLVADVKQLNGAHWNQDARRWEFPAGQYDKVLAVAQRYAADEQSSVPTPSKGQESDLRVVSRGEGYGGRPFKAGNVFRDPKDPQKILCVVSASERYFRDDGLSFGVGDDQGYIYSARCREATEDEARPLYEREEKQASIKAATERWAAIKTEITQQGEVPDGDNHPEGELFGKGPDIVGGGDWFVVGPKFIWYVRNNGMDGDDWSANNVKTGGAGARGWRIPHTADLAEEIQTLDKIEGLQKSMATG